MFTVTTREGIEANLHPAELAGADVVCCRSLKRPEGESGGPIRRVLEGLGLSCGCFVPDRTEAARGGVPVGLAILTGIGIWPLNSGRLRIAGEDRDTGSLAQFMHLRKQNASLLVLNLRLDPSPEEQHTLLGAVFAHPLFKERYSGVVLCGDRRVAVGERVLRSLARSVSWAYCPVPTGDYGPLLFVPGNGQNIPTTVYPVAPPDLNAAERGRTLALRIRRQPVKRSDRVRVPLSYREQWLGGQECFRAFVL